MASHLDFGTVGTSGGLLNRSLLNFMLTADHLHSCVLF